MSERFAFRIPIGDWSGDGHGKKEEFYATAAKPIAAVREAYFAAKEKRPDLCPESFCNQYEDASIPSETVQALRDAGCPLPDGLDPDEDGNGIETDHMAAIVLWYINLGDPSVDARGDASARPPMLAFYGHDEKRRHIGFIGYGLLGS